MIGNTIANAIDERLGLDIADPNKITRLLLKRLEETTFAGIFLTFTHIEKEAQENRVREIQDYNFQSTIPLLGRIINAIAYIFHRIFHYNEHSRAEAEALRLGEMCGSITDIINRGTKSTIPNYTDDDLRNYFKNAPPAIFEVSRKFFKLFDSLDDNEKGRPLIQKLLNAKLEVFLEDEFPATLEALAAATNKSDRFFREMMDKFTINTEIKDNKFIKTLPLEIRLLRRAHEVLPTGTVVERATFGTTDIVIKRGSVVTEPSECIVNAANSTLEGGGGVDGAIHLAAGNALRDECISKRDKIFPNKSCPTSGCIITGAHGINTAKHIIHAVGPIGENPEKLRETYENILKTAVQNGIKDIALCCISIGIFGYPIERATPIVLQTVKDFCKANPGKLNEIRFMMFSDKEAQVYKECMAA